MKYPQTLSELRIKAKDLPDYLREWFDDYEDDQEIGRAEYFKRMNVAGDPSRGQHAEVESCSIPPGLRENDLEALSQGFDPYDY